MRAVWKLQAQGLASEAEDAANDAKSLVTDANNIDSSANETNRLALGNSDFGQIKKKKTAKWQKVGHIWAKNTARG